MADGEHTLMLAPTGSGKTLAAFLHAIDVVGTSPPPTRPGISVLYVSPLKALAYDVERNLRAPLAGIEASIANAESFRRIAIDVRTGDTSAKERRRALRHPGDILITTPESLYLLLTSQARETLRTVRTVIIDEIHAVAGTKRGVHLALSLERLCALTDHEPQRIGLSATQRPLAEVARFLGGDRNVHIVDASEPPRLELSIEVPEPDTGPVPDDTVWPSILRRLVTLVTGHTSTIIFCNSRRTAEKLAQEINELTDAELCKAHHGSMSRHQRTEVEAELKAGTLRALAATSSLELGIDMGAVDLVVQVESPGSASRGLQRIGRAGHGVGQISRGVILPKFPADLVEATVVGREMLDGEVEALAVPGNCLDVLAQQVVAACAMDSWQLDDLYRVVSRAHSFRDLSRAAFVEVLEMLAGRYPSDDFIELRPRLIWDRDADMLRGRSGAKTVALINGGTIPDRACSGCTSAKKARASVSSTRRWSTKPGAVMSFSSVPRVGASKPSPAIASSCNRRPESRAPCPFGAATVPAGPSRSGGRSGPSYERFPCSTETLPPACSKTVSPRPASRRRHPRSSRQATRGHRGLAQ